MYKKYVAGLLIMVLLLTGCGTTQPSSSVEPAESTSQKAENLQEESVEVTKVTEEETEFFVENTIEETQVLEEEKQPEDMVQIQIDDEYADLTPSEGFQFESNGDGTCTLVKIGVCEDDVIVIPAVSQKGDKVTEIAEYAFYGCEDIQSIIFAGLTLELESCAFQSCKFETLVITGCELVVGENAFSYGENVKEILISGSNIEIDEYAFYDAGKDAAVTIRNTYGVIDDTAFQSSGLSSVIIEGCDLEIGDNAFSYCEDIASVMLNNSNLEIGEYAFYDSGDEMTVAMTESNIILEDAAFQSCEVASLSITGCESTLGSNVFSYCEDLIDITIGAGAIEVGEYAFYSCPELLSVSVAEGDAENAIVIMEGAFQSCEKLTKVVLGGATLEIGGSAFSYCEDLAEVVIKSGSLDAGDYSFYGCAGGLKIDYNGGIYSAEAIEDAD